MSPVTTEELHEAIVDGDLTTIEAFFSQPRVREQVDATNTYIHEAPTPVRSFPDTLLLWFIRPLEQESGVPLVASARNGHVNVIEWFFSTEQAALMGATLAYLLPQLARFDVPSTRCQEQCTHALVVLEILLTSTVFCDFISDQDKQSILNDIAGHCHTPALIPLVIAHGACVNEEVLSEIARYAVYDSTALLEKEGACFVGAKVLTPPSEDHEYATAASFLKRGVDWNTGPPQLLIEAAERGDGIERYVTNGFVDVDAQDVNGMTALMHVASVDWRQYSHPADDDPPHMALLLLRYCDVNMIDHHGRSALHYASQKDHRIAKELLAVGANPNTRDHNGYAAFDYIDGYDMKWSGWQSLIKRFLECGADPFFTPGAVALDRVERVPSLYDRLTNSQDGLEFIYLNRSLFEYRVATMYS